jgi:hypothetical protein
VGINGVDAGASVKHVFLSMETEPCASAGLLWCVGVLPMSSGTGCDAEFALQHARFCAARSTVM